MLHLYRKSTYNKARIGTVMVQQMKTDPVKIVATEHCYNIDVEGKLSEAELNTLKWLLSETFEPKNFSDKSFLSVKANKKKSNYILEVGPRENVTTSWSTNAISVCRACGITKIKRIEISKRYLLKTELQWDSKIVLDHLSSFCDRMRERVYLEPLTTFDIGIKPDPVYTIPLIEDGPDALKKIKGISMDEFDRKHYHWYFAEECLRNPTNVEIMDLNGSNSQHSRHDYFSGIQIIDGKTMPMTLMQVVESTLKASPGNSVLAFCDNSSVIKGYKVKTINPESPGNCSRFIEIEDDYDILFTAETHNFPSGVSPFPGAETGTGGRIRDVQGVGRGGLTIAGTVAYCVGNLLIPGYDLPWEDSSFAYPDNLASPLEIEIEASNGASDYGNKYGEPVIQGFTRSFGMRMLDGKRYEWLKPIMFTAGVGQMNSGHLKKGEAEKGMLIVDVGGFAYRIGFGGGAASSLLQGEQSAELDFDAVQRGDAEMEQKMNRVIRACIEMGVMNPIISIHDQGAVGPANVLKELVEKAGGTINIRKINSGDPTLSVVELWVCEYQERNGLLIRPERIKEFIWICDREKVPYEVLGHVTGDGIFTVHDEQDGSMPVHLHLDKVLGSMPQKTFSDTRIIRALKPLEFPDITVREVLDRVFRLISVGSKRFLTNKVDRCVTGLVAQQQCAGPLQLTVADVAVIAQSHFGLTGAAISIGEQPIVGLVNPGAQGRMTVGEMLTNIVWAKISALEDIKCSGNWMAAPKLPGEGAKLYDTAIAMRNIMIRLGIAIDGGKDSLSMATKVTLPDKTEELVKSPGQLVLSGYCTMPDITKVITPDIKRPGESSLLFIDLADGKNRLGGSALAQVYNQLGNESPDVENPDYLKHVFNTVQTMIAEDMILAGHDRSDDGLITTLLEMAFSGNCGIDVNIHSGCTNPLKVLFSGELGLVIEVLNEDVEDVYQFLQDNYVKAQLIGKTRKEKNISVAINGQMVLEEDMRALRQLWEETSYQLERIQSNPKTAEEEKENIFDRRGPQYVLTFKPEETAPAIFNAEVKPKVAIIREEGSNSDREMTSAFFQAGFETWDVTMTDLLEGRVTLDMFRGIAFVGGFSYADVLDSAKGWAGVIRFNKKIWDQFQIFYNRPDTFSLGVCNGCQLMALLGWVPFYGLSGKEQPRFIQNTSGRFESRFSSVKILKSPAIMLKGMEESVLGIHVAHGEGKAYFPSEFYYDEAMEEGLAPIRYVDDGNFITTDYPFNPNGSRSGIAAFCSPDGRHLAIMPHPERTFLTWQWPWMPDGWKKELKAPPWMKMFQNAYNFCVQKDKKIIIAK